MQKPSCIIDGCDKPARSSSGSSMCPMHYHRNYRHGSTTKVATRISTIEGQGKYLTMDAKGHPVAPKCGKAYVHRVVLYDAIGDGPHPCHWCGTALAWRAMDDGTSERLEVDHIDFNRSNNSPSNLVPACRKCNSGRGSQRRSKALRESGWWSRNDTVSRLSDPNLRRRPVVADEKVA